MGHLTTLILIQEEETAFPTWTHLALQGGTPTSGAAVATALRLLDAQPRGHHFPTGADDAMGL